MKLLQKLVLEQTAGKNVLSLGCIGYRNINEQYSLLLKNAASLFGIDKNLEEMKKLNHETITYGDLNQFTWFDKTKFKNIDVIVCTEVVEHLKYPLQTLEYIKKNKKKETLLVLSVPNGTSLGRTIHGIFNTKTFSFQDRNHLAVHSKRTISNLCSEAGLEVMNIKPYARKKLVSLIPFQHLGSGFFVLCK